MNATEIDQAMQRKALELAGELRAPVLTVAVLPADDGGDTVVVSGAGLPPGSRAQTISILERALDTVRTGMYVSVPRPS